MPDHDVADDVRSVVLAIAVAAGRAVRMEVGLLGCALHVGNRLERLVRDVDPFGRTTRLLRMLGRDDRHRLAVIEDAIDGEHGLVGKLEPVPLGSGHVLVREHGMDTRHPQRIADVDVDDACVGMRAAQRVPEQHPGRGEIARVRELALHLGRCVDPGDELADLPDLQRVRSRPRHPGQSPLPPPAKPAASLSAGSVEPTPAAARTASKIFA